MCTRRGCMKYKNTKFQELNKDGLIPAKSLYEDEGWSTVKISEYFGISTTTVLKILEKTRDYRNSKNRKQFAHKSVNINN